MVVAPDMKVLNERFEKIEQKLEKLERGQAVSQYFFKLMSDQNKELLKDTKTVVYNSQEIMEAMEKYEELVKDWQDDHPLIEATMKFQEYVQAKMNSILEQQKRKNNG